jgi:hypothetical protein
MVKGRGFGPFLILLYYIEARGRRSQDILYVVSKKLCSLTTCSRSRQAFYRIHKSEVAGRRPQEKFINYMFTFM